MRFSVYIFKRQKLLLNPYLFKEQFLISCKDWYQIADTKQCKITE